MIHHWRLISILFLLLGHCFSTNAQAQARTLTHADEKPLDDELQSMYEDEYQNSEPELDDAEYDIDYFEETDDHSSIADGDISEADTIESNTYSSSTDQTYGSEESQATLERRQKVSPFVEIFGDTLYRWKDSSKQEVHILPTEELLAGKDVVGIYFSASWCGPCRQFTPLLAQFYDDMNKKGRKFEVVWVSRDRSTEEFVSYYQHMPWLAVPVEQVQQCLEVASPRYKLQGIPHLVILDGQDASIYTLDGRTQVMKDKYGLEFPWRPRSLMNMLPRPLRNALKQQLDSFREKVLLTLQGFLEGFLPEKLLQRIQGHLLHAY